MCQAISAFGNVKYIDKPRASIVEPPWLRKGASAPDKKSDRIKFKDMNNNQPIGVFDSCIGGLTVVRALMERVPFENIVYFGDTARVPYGIKSVETITHYAKQITEFLLKQNVKLLIIACNTMAAVAREAVASLSSVPILDVIDAGARIAVAKTRDKAVGVIGTLATVNSNAYPRAIYRYSPEIRTFSQ